jgi:alpha-1,2-mannosyltransferase
MKTPASESRQLPQTKISSRESFVLAEQTARSTARWWWLVVSASLGFTIILMMVMPAIRGKDASTALAMTVHGHIARLFKRTGYDSWLPMLKAARRHATDTPATPYAVFFDGQAKFQYPPTALLLVEWLPKKLVDEALQKWDGSVLQLWSGWFCRLMVFITIGLSVALAHSVLKPLSDQTKISARNSTWLTIAIIAAGLSFYPFVVGHELGQIQVALNALMAAALLFFVRGNKILAGVCIGLCCLVKPQYGLILVWSLLRRENRLSAGLFLTVITIVPVSCIYYGWDAYVDYLKVLGILAKQGEVYWYNQSVNGLLHRFIDPSAAYYFDNVGSPLPPYRWVVHYVSSGVAAAMILLALLPKMGKYSIASLVDLAIVIVVATIASPVAWNHHYGVFFPVVVAILPTVLLAARRKKTLAWLFTAAYLAISTEIVGPEFMFQSRWLGVLASHIFFGGVLLLIVLWIVRAQSTKADSPAAAVPGRNLF